MALALIETCAAPSRMTDETRTDAMEHPGLRSWHGPHLRALTCRARLSRKSGRSLHFENTRSGGEWLETRLLTAGRRTNPWYQECRIKRYMPGEMLSFDTDMIGPYGYCADLSRSWTIDHTAMSDAQRRIYAAAIEQIGHNVALIAAGIEYREYKEKSWVIPEKFLAQSLRLRAAWRRYV